MLIWGEKSRVVHAANAEELLAALPGATVIRVEGAGHMIPFGNLDGFIHAVSGVLSETGQGR